MMRAELTSSSKGNASNFTEEEISNIIVQLQNPLTGVRVQDYKWRMRTYQQTFTGEEGAQWLLENTRIADLSEAEKLGQRLLVSGAIRSLSNDPNMNFQATHHIYQLRCQKALDDIGFLDELLKEYLLYRGLTESLTTFEKEIKQDRLHHFEGVRVSQQLFQHIQDSNLSGFLDLWRYLDKTLFSRVDQKYVDTVKDLEFGLLRYYLVSAINSNKISRVHELFREIADQLISEEKWAKWFYLPYIVNPQKHPDFAVYFTKQWVDHLSHSVTNFVSTCLYQAPLPRLLLFNLERAARKSLEQEVEALRAQNSKQKRENHKLQAEFHQMKKPTVVKMDAHKPTPSSEMMAPISSPKISSPIHAADPESFNFLGKQRQYPHDSHFD